MKSYQSFSFFLNKCKLAALIFLVFQALSCSKGSTGPAGATGPAGSAGPTGPTGPAGTANVEYSAWFTPPSYSEETIFGSYGFYYTQSASAITQKILDSGVVITFGKLDGYNSVIWPTDQVEQMPIIINYVSGGMGNVDTWSALATVGNLKIELISSLNVYGSIPGAISTAHQFRYVIIPGGVQLTGSGLVAKAGDTQVNSEENSRRQEVISNYSQMSYEQICKLLNIPE